MISVWLSDMLNFLCLVVNNSCLTLYENSSQYDRQLNLIKREFNL